MTAAAAAAGGSRGGAASWLPPAVARNWPLIQRLLVTVAMIAVIRMGYYVPLPGADMQRLPSPTLGTTEGARRAAAACAPASHLAARMRTQCPCPRQLLASAASAASSRSFVPLTTLRPSNAAGERIMRAIYGQASELPASLFDLGISPYINASILVSILLLLPKDLIEWQPLDRLREARKEGKSVSGVARAAALV